METEVKIKKATSLKRSSLSSRKKNKLIFYCTMVTLPVLQFCVFYLYINLRSFVLGFQEFSMETRGFVWAGFKNFTQIFKDFQNVLYLRASITNSLTLFLWTFIFGSIGAVLFSYYIYKQHVGSMFFKIMLYLPQILGGVVVVIMYRYFLEDAIPAIVKSVFGKEMRGLLSNPDTKRFMIIFFTIYVSFGTQILVYSSAMSGISDSIIESAQLDGITPIKELVFIVLPSIWSTFVTFMVSSVVGIFTHQMSLFTFYGINADASLYTFGYYLYRNAKTGTNMEYPYLSAMGLLLTVIVVPLTLFTRWSLKKFGPSKE